MLYAFGPSMVERAVYALYVRYGATSGSTADSAPPMPRCSAGRPGSFERRGALRASSVKLEPFALSLSKHTCRPLPMRFDRLGSNG